MGEDAAYRSIGERGNPIQARVRRTLVRSESSNGLGWEVHPWDRWAGLFRVPANQAGPFSIPDVAGSVS